MQVVTGTVVEGKVVLEGASLPEGTVVTVYAPQPEDVVCLPPLLQAELEQAIDEADRDEGISAEELFAQLEKYRCPWRSRYASSRAHCRRYIAQPIGGAGTERVRGK